VFAADPAHNVSGEMIERKLRVQPELFSVAIADGELVGTVMAGYDGVRGWLYRLAVSTSQRRAGVGTALVRQAEAEMGKLCCPKVNLQVRARTPPSSVFSSGTKPMTTWGWASGWLLQGLEQVRGAIVARGRAVATARDQAQAPFAHSCQIIVTLAKPGRASGLAPPALMPASPPVPVSDGPSSAALPLIPPLLPSLPQLPGKPEPVTSWRPTLKPRTIRGNTSSLRWMALSVAKTRSRGAIWDKIVLYRCAVVLSRERPSRCRVIANKFAFRHHRARNALHTGTPSEEISNAVSSFSFVFVSDRGFFGDWMQFG
jgi:Acetyltransferase (GNAT) family